MPPLDVCLETVFTDLPPVERVARIAKCGYKAVECWFLGLSWEVGDMSSTKKRMVEFAKACRDHGMRFNNLVVNSADGSVGGHLTRWQDHKGYLERLKRVIEVAKTADCSMAITCTGNRQYKVSFEDQRRSVTSVLRKAAEIAESSGFSLLLEPLNTVVDHPGYFLPSAEKGAAIVREVNSPNLKLLYDVYHMQIMCGNLLAFIRDNLDIIGHFHSAGVPGRHELFDSEVNYPYLVSQLEKLGYRGYFGLEYFPAMADHEASLKAIKTYLAESE